MAAHFTAEVHNYRLNGLTRFSISSDPMIPAALTPIVKSIRGLYTIDEQPTGQLLPAQTSSPNATTSGGAHFLTPEDFKIIYDASTVGFDGTGQTIGIVGRARTYSADVDNFRTVTNSGFHSPTEVVPTTFGGVDPGPPLTAPPTSGTIFGDQGEATLDVLRAGSTAPNATILLVVATSSSGGVGVDTQYLVQTSPLPAQVINISFGACEAAAGPSGVSFWDSLFEQAAAEGISVFVSSGDSGAAGCDAAFSTPPATPGTNSPNYICSSSYATCVGGTQFNDTANPATYWNAGNDSHLGSALGYIPEGGWNEPKPGTATQVASSGGGVSSFVATPSWQTGTGVPAGRTGRYTPDISFSGACHDGYFACYAAGGGSCVATGGSFTFVAFCGTSASAPSMAGVTALLDQELGFAQGNLNSELYHLAQSAPAIFHDTTVASSGVSSCSVNTPSMCNNSIPSPSGLTGGQAGYLVTNGYDLVTGLGSLDIASFLAGFANPFSAPTVTVTPAATTITAPQSLSVAITVAATTGNPTPSGTVKLSAGSYTSAATNLSSGSATIVIPAESLYASIDILPLTAQYTPDTASVSTYRVATGSTNIVVKFIDPTITLTLSSSTITTAQTLNVTAQANGGSGNPPVTGQVSVSVFFPSNIGIYSTNGNLTSGSLTLTIPAGVLPPGVSSIDALYVPDGQSVQNYDQVFSANSPNVTVAAGPITTPTVTVTPSSSTITTAQADTITVAVTPATGNPPPTGLVTLTSGTYSNIASVAAGSATFSIPAGTLPVGADTVTATYSGDYNYNPASGTSQVTVTALTKITPTITVTPSLSTISTGQSLDLSASISGGIGYPAATGTVGVAIGNYSTSLFLNNGVWSNTIPAGVLPVGSDTLTVTYTPDTASASVFNSATGTTSVTVTAAAYTLSATGLTLTRGGSGVSTVTVSTANNYAGTVSLKCSVTSSPTGAKDIPTCTATQTVTLGSGTTTGTAGINVRSTQATAAMQMPVIQKGSGSLGLSGGAMLAFILFCVPERRRFARWLPIAIVTLALFGALSACGGGGGSVSSQPKDTGTTPGAYTLTVIGTGSDAATTAASTTFTVTVN